MTMQIKSFLDNILVATLDDVLRVHLYIKFLQKGFTPFENDLLIIIELYKFGGYSGREKQDQFFKLCLDKKLRKSKQSVRNTISKYTILGVINKMKNTNIKVNEEFIPSIQFDKLIINYKISHAN